MKVMLQLLLSNNVVNVKPFNKNTIGVDKKLLFERDEIMWPGFQFTVTDYLVVTEMNGLENLLQSIELRNQDYSSSKLYKSTEPWKS